MISLLLLFLPAFSATCLSYTELIKENEGFKSCVYNDTKGHPTICYGFNLDALGAKKSLEEISPGKYAALMDTTNKNRCLSNSNCNALLTKDVATALKDTLSLYGKKHCTCVLSVLVDFVYNLGKGGAQKFKNMKKQLDAGNYAGAAEEMKNSLWCGQVKTRCVKDVALMAKGC